MAYLRATEEVLNDAFNEVTSVTHTAITVGSSSTEVLAANPKRRYVIFINDDADEVIYLNLGGTAAVNTGIRVSAVGGSFEMSANLGNLYKGAITGVSTSGNKQLLVTEGT